MIETLAIGLALGVSTGTAYYVFTQLTRRIRILADSVFYLSRRVDDLESK